MNRGGGTDFGLGRQVKITKIISQSEGLSECEQVLSTYLSKYKVKNIYLYFWEIHSVQITHRTSKIWESWKMNQKPSADLRPVL